MFQHILAFERKFRERVHWEIKKILNFITFDIGDIRSQIIYDLEILQKRRSLFSYEPYYSCAQHKMIEVLEGALNQNVSIIFDLLKEEHAMTTLGEGISGTSQGTFAKILLFYLWIHKVGKNILNSWIDETVLAHVVPCSIPFPDDFTFKFSDSRTPNGFIFIHNGYAFGGHRNEKRYPSGKEFGPHDCSSWINLVLNFPSFITTQDWEKFHQYKKNIYLRKNLIPTENEGHIYVYTHCKKKSVGHIVIILKELEDKNILTIGCERSMPTHEGIGFKIIPREHLENKTYKHMFFKFNKEYFKIK